MDTCYVDSETTSLREPHKLAGRRTWEVALIRVPENGDPVRACWLQIVDVDLADADPKSLEIGRFHQRWSYQVGARWDVPEAEVDGQKVRLRNVEESAAARVIEDLTRGAVLAGSNPAFDAANFADILDRNQLPVTWYHHHRDIPNVATGWLLAGHQASTAIPTKWTDASYSTGKLSEECGIEVPADRHSAWADTLWMYRWDRALRGLDVPAPA